MANTIAEIVQALASVKIATTVAEAVGITVPAELATFENDALVALNTVQGFQPPSSLTADLSNVVAAANGLSSIINLPSLSGILNALVKIKSLDQDITSGQIAIIGNVGASFDGVADRVIFAAYRESGTFAKMVDSGTTDTSVTG